MVLALVAFLTVGVGGRADAATAPGLGTAETFAVLAGSTVTNTGSSLISGDLGVSPGTAVTGFPPGRVINGTIHANDAVAIRAQADALNAFNALADEPCTEDLTGQDLGGLTLTPGVYCFDSSAQLTGTLTLDARGDPNAVFIFKIGTTLTTAPGSRVVLINGADPCNVFFQVGSSATLGTTTRFVGTIVALQSITAQTGASVQGRLLALNGAVTLDTNNVTRPDCTAPPTTSTSSTTSTTSSTTSTTSPTPPTSTSSTTSTTSPTPTTSTSSTSTSSTTSTTSPTPPTSTSSTSTTMPSTTTTTTATGGGGETDTTTTTTVGAGGGGETATTTTTTVGAGGGGETATTTTISGAGGGGGAGTTTTTSGAGGGGETATTTTTSGAGGGGGAGTTTTTISGAGGGGGAGTTTTTSGAGGGGGAGTTTTTAVGAGVEKASDGSTAATTAGQGRNLPKTGSPVRGQSVAGVLAIALGSVVLLVNARRQGTGRSDNITAS